MLYKPETRPILERIPPHSTTWPSLKRMTRPSRSQRCQSERALASHTSTLRCSSPPGGQPPSDIRHGPGSTGSMTQRMSEMRGGAAFGAKVTCRWRGIMDPTRQGGRVTSTGRQTRHASPRIAPVTRATRKSEVSGIKQNLQPLLRGLALVCFTRSIRDPAGWRVMRINGACVLELTHRVLDPRPVCRAPQLK
jgi:hypothetical protein